jgi:hypothetical protein
MKITKVEFDSYLDDREIAFRVWELLQDFTVFIHAEENGKARTFELIIKKGFITDYCSVPRIPFAYLLYDGIANYQGVMHDGLYSASSLVTLCDFDTGMRFHPDRAFCDEAFLAALEGGVGDRPGISSWKSKPMYWAVRWQGDKYYQRKI